MRLLVTVLAAFVLAGCAKPGERANEVEAAAEEGPVKGVDRSHRGERFPDVRFLQDDGDGKGEMSYEPFLGVPTLINFWASWCAPCVKELPTLKALNESGKFDGWVVPLNQDSGPQQSVSAFMTKIGVAELGNYQDPTMAVTGALGVQVMPTTILYDANGKEVWRYVGDLDWTSAEAARLLAEGGAGRKG